jgi:hypothetical protein
VHPTLVLEEFVLVVTMQEQLLSVMDRLAMETQSVFLRLALLENACLAIME